MIYFLEQNEFLWDNLKKEIRSIIVYGTGNGADKLFDLCEHYGIEIDALFASNEFVREIDFSVEKVQSFEEIKFEYKDFVILLLFAVFQDDMVQKILDLSGNKMEVVL